MSKVKSVLGKDLMLFVGGKALALATSCKLSISAETIDTQSKDSGIWAEKDIKQLSWNGSSENLFSADDKVSGYDTLLDLMLNRQPVEAKFGIPANANADGVPAAGWALPAASYSGNVLISNLELKNDINWDWFILLLAKTGMRFSEGLAVTPKNFDFAHQMLSINKTWDYKGNGGFLPTKNKSSVRKIQIDWQTVIQFAALVKDVPEDKPIFVFKEHAYNSTVNDVLERHCNRAKIPVISVHGLRHTHASVLLFAGVSIASVARRLGHSSMTTTQKTYLHIIQELENQDIDLVMRSLSGLS